MPPNVSVITPTYNRADKLPRLFGSLEAQTFRDFEWVVADDGSVDGTAALVARLAGTATFRVRYLPKENGGRHTALNLGVRSAAGVFCAVIDDDDWYVPEALERLKQQWDSLAEPERFAEVQGLCLMPSGEVIGSPYPSAVFDSDYYELNEVLGIRGDRLGMIRTDVLRAHPFPEEFGGKFLDERIVWNRISLTYLTRGINEPIGYKEYLPTGISLSEQHRHVELSAQRLLYYRELLSAARPLPVGSRYRAYANLIRNGLHQGQPLRAELGSAPSRPWWLAGLPAGVALFWRDRARQSRATG